MFSAVINVFGHILQILYGITENWGSQLRTCHYNDDCIYKDCSVPSTRKQTVAMAKMQEIQPEVQRIQKI